MTPNARRHEGQQARALVRMFFVRFFENETTGGRMEPESLIWLVAGLVTLSFVIPLGSMVRWGVIGGTPAPEGGAEFLHMISASDKIFIIGYTMTMAGLIAAFLWPSLLVERVDILILKPRPVRDRTLVGAKCGALAVLFAIAAVAMNAPGAVAVALFLGAPGGVVGVLRLVSVHFAVLCAAGLCAFAAVIAAQSVLLALVGPRVFSRVGPTSQFVLVSGLIALFIVSVVASAGAVITIYGINFEAGQQAQPWIFLLPPVWFFGAYETLLGTPLSSVHLLAERAAASLAGVLATACVCYPIAYRRVAANALTGSRGRTGRSLVSSLSGGLPALLTREPVGQATIQFVMATLARAGRHRLVVGTALNAAVAFVVLVVAVNISASHSQPTGVLLVLPIFFMSCMIVGIRIAMAIPAELPASWIFSVSTGRGWQAHRSAIRRFLWAGVAATVFVALPAYGVMWGIETLMVHAALCLAIGSLLVELALIGVDGMPFTMGSRPGRNQIRTPWPLYLFLAGAVLFVFPVAEGVMLRAHARRAPAILALSIFLVARLVRLWSSQGLSVPGSPEESPDPAPGVVLH